MTHEHAKGIVDFQIYFDDSNFREGFQSQATRRGCALESSIEFLFQEFVQRLEGIRNEM